MRSWSWNLSNKGETTGCISQVLKRLRALSNLNIVIADQILAKLDSEGFIFPLKIS